jgi:hypothetical protein
MYNYLQGYTYYLILYTIYTSPLSVQAQYSRLCPISSGVRYNGKIFLYVGQFIFIAQQEHGYHFRQHMRERQGNIISRL